MISKQLKRPAMIIFDYGHTIAYEAEMDFKKGIEALMKFVCANPGGFTAQEVFEKAQELFSMLRKNLTANNLEIKHEDFHRALFDFLNISFSLTNDEICSVFWNGLAPAKPMKGIAELLDFCKTQNIRTAVISNLSFPQKTLRTRLKELVPSAAFEFVLVSSDYIFRKPHPAMFNAALKIANLKSEEVWYVGDNPIADVDGAANAGIFPVWFCSGLDCPYNNNNATNMGSSSPIQNKPCKNHLKINSFKELITVLS